jgi:ubiquinone/menaquinone biosynthesis C-methylase UbiE
MSDLIVGQLDRWRSDMPQTEERAAELADFVEVRARSVDEVTIREAYLDLLDLQPGERVIDVGAGSGVVTRDIARRVGPGGHVLAVDSNLRLMELGRRLAEEQGVGDLIEWREGDARRLPVEDGAFDVVVCATVLAHIPDSEPVVAELMRVLRPGGRIGIFEIDPESFMIGHPDRVMTRRILAAATDYGFANALVSRRLPGLMKAAGVANLQTRAFTSLETESTGFVARAAALRPVVAAQAGAITQAEGDAWLGQLRTEMDAGRFLGGTTYIFAWGTKPA